MKLSATIYRLKRNARLLSRERNIPLNQALNEIARQEGCKSWSLLAARLTAEAPAARLFGQLRQGDLLLVGARPGQGKTLLGLELALEAIRSGACGKFFSLEYALQAASARSGLTRYCCEIGLNSTAPMPSAPTT